MDLLINERVHIYVCVDYPVEVLLERQLLPCTVSAPADCCSVISSGLWHWRQYGAGHCTVLKLEFEPRQWWNNVIWYDIWYMIYDIPCMIYDTRYMVWCDMIWWYMIWYMIHDIYDIYVIWYMIYDMVYDTWYIWYMVCYMIHDMIYDTWYDDIWYTIYGMIWCYMIHDIWYDI